MKIEGEELLWTKEGRKELDRREEAFLKTLTPEQREAYLSALKEAAKAIAKYIDAQILQDIINEVKAKQ